MNETTTAGPIILPVTYLSSRRSAVYEISATYLNLVSIRNSVVASTLLAEYLIQRIASSILRNHIVKVQIEI